LDKNVRDYLKLTGKGTVQVTSSTNTGGLNGSAWYTQQAARAVNQALGRVIRHKFDYGAIILADERFAYTRTRNALSKWVQPRVNVHESFGEAAKSVSAFFRRAKATPEWNRKKETSNNKSKSSALSSINSSSYSGGNNEDIELMNELAGIHRPSTAAAALAMRSGNNAGNNAIEPLRSNPRVERTQVSLLNNLQKNNVGAAMSTSFNNDSEEFSEGRSLKRSKKRQMIPINHRSRSTEADKLADLLTTDAQSSSETSLHSHNTNSARVEHEQRRKKRQQEKLHSILFVCR